MPWRSSPTRDRITQSLAHQAFVDFDFPDIDRLLIAGAVVLREEGHFRIESGEETFEELEMHDRRAAGQCDCGFVLSNRAERYCCRACGREYRLD